MWLSQAGSRPSLSFTLALVALTGGCSPPPPRSSAPSPAPAPMAAIPSAPASAHPAGVLTVDDLVRLARQHHPLARMAAIEARAGAGGVRAARAWANPEVDLEAGRARGRGADAEADAIVGRVAIQQPIAWPAERSRRIAAATVAGVAGEAAAALPLLDLEASVRQAALQVIFARKGQALAEAAL